jgi:drug/metabolite transporter (DMT)-like permease
MLVAVVCFMITSYREVLGANRQQMLRWCVVPFMYAAMLNASIYAYEYLTLTLVTIFRNLAPLITIAVEQFTMPPEHRPKVTAPVVLSLVTMIIGAILFSYSGDGFSWFGLLLVVVNTLIAILDRLLQRRLLVEECKDLPASACCVISNTIGLIPSLLLAGFSHEFKEVTGHVENWMDPGVILLLIMSGFMGIGIGLFGLMCQKTMSATSFMVLQNMSKVGVVAIGVSLFGDKVNSRQRFMGMIFSLAGSAAYGYARSVEMSNASKAERAPLRSDAANKA